MKQRIKLNESKLNRLIKESIKKVLNEEVSNIPVPDDISGYLNDYNGRYYDDRICDAGDDAINKWGIQTYGRKRWCSFNADKRYDAWEQYGIHTPKGRKYYDDMHKKAENEISWDEVDRAYEDRLDSLETEPHGEWEDRNINTYNDRWLNVNDDKYFKTPVNDPLDESIKESIKKVLNESYANDIEKWNFFCTNYPHDFIKQIWGGTHLETHFEDKFNYLHKTVGSYGVMTAFYLQLDGEHRRKLEQFAINCYI